MQNFSDYGFAYAADGINSASRSMSAAGASYAKTATAIISLMAVIFFTAILHLPALDILITIIMGIIILIVRGNSKPVSRT